ncbi:MAG: CDP-alcohol phosphatidyltransferase family protein [Candidatus Omnitrophica bacterium]|jgi:CDP-diacylglycerol--glycerol-3-phosphate 3-phosphatidyltransferase|nr:CDP-alcohol phosphatidyltransferase family protein [Candidatus Omnitrophota bacterium]
MLYFIKGSFQKNIRWVAGSWMTPNVATLLGVVSVVLTALGFYFGFTHENLHFFLLLVPVFLFMRMMMNALDGLLSREYKLASVAGELLNEGVDVIGDIVCYGILYFVPGMPKFSLIIYLMMIWTAEFFGVLGKSMPGGSRRYENVFSGKPDRALWMGVFAVVLFFRPQFMKYVSYYFLFLSILLVLSCILRIRKILECARGKKYESYTWVGE